MSFAWNPDDARPEYLTFSNNNYTCAHTGTADGQAAVRAVDSKSSGKWYFEFHLDAMPSANFTIGWMNASHSLTDRVGGDGIGVGVGYWTGGRIYRDGAYIYLTGFVAVEDDYVMVAADLDTGNFWFGKNGTWYDSGDPANGTNPSYTEDEVIGLAMYPAVALYAHDAHIGTLRTSVSTFEGTVPTGFSALESATGTTEPAITADEIAFGETSGADLERHRGLVAGLGLGEEAGGAFSGQGEISGTLGISAAIGKNAIFTRGIIAGLGLGEACNNAHTYEAGAVAGLGLTGGALSSISVTRENLAGIGFAEISGGFNYSAWLRENKHLATYRYHGLLTGTADGLPDCQLSGLKSIQFRMRSQAASYLSLVLVHNTDHLEAIGERQNGEIVVDMVAVVDGVESLREELIRAPFYSVRYDKGPKSRSITLVGYVDLANVGGNRVALQGVTKEIMLADGLLQYRCARPDFYLRPGDTAVHGDSEFVVDSVSSLVSPTSQYMDVAE